MANKRIYYATQSVQLKPRLASGDSWNNDQSYVTPRGLQSVGMTTNFNLTQLFELGQQELYDNVEGVPEIQVTLQKTLDGTIPLYLICMGGTLANGVNKNIGELANNRVDFKLGVYDDTDLAAVGSSTYGVECSGMYLSSIGYTLPLDGFATEDVTLVGNSKKWSNNTSNNGTWSESAPQTAKSAVRRLNVNIAGSTLPGDIPAGSHYQSINVRANLGREAINELGQLAPYCRYVKFPLEVTSEFAISATEGDKKDADDYLTSGWGTCSSNKNLSDRTILIKICGTGGTSDSNNMEINLGTKNKLTSVNYTGGDTGGGNATVTYSYQTFNFLKVNVAGTFASVD
jgi:hypothetical protein